MSSIPTGAATIVFQVDRSNIDAVKAELAKGFTTTVRADFVAPAGPGGTGGGSLGVASASGPATFANPNGRATYIGPAGNNMTTIGAGFTYAGGIGGAGGGQGLNQAATQLTQAAQQLIQAAQRLGGGGGGAGGGAGGGGAGGSGALSFTGLARYASAGFAVREALHIAEGMRNYGMDVSAGNGTPEGKLRAELNWFKSKSSIPIFGQIYGLASDPDGTIQAGLERTVNELGMNEEIGRGRYTMSRRSVSMRDSADIAGMRGFSRQRAMSAAEYRESVMGIREGEREQAGKLTALHLSERQRIRDDLGPSTALQLLPWVEQNPDTPEMDSALRQQSQLESQRFRELRRKSGELIDLAGKQRDAEDRESRRQQTLAERGLLYRRESAGARAQRRFGAADEADFYNKGELEILAADPLLKDATRSTIQRERAAHQAQIDANIQLRDSSTAATRQFIGRNPLAAQIENIQSRTNADIRNSHTFPEGMAIRRQGDAELEQARQRFGDTADLVSARLAAGNESMRIAISTHPERPALGAALSSVNSIYRGAILGAFGTSRDGSIDEFRKPGIERQQLEAGMLGLRAYQQDFRRGLHSEQLDSINQQATSGPGTTSPAELNAAIKQMSDTLSAIRTDLSKLNDNVEALIGSDQ